MAQVLVRRGLGDRRPPRAPGWRPATATTPRASPGSTPRWRSSWATCARARASPSTATTTSTASARPRSSSARCARWAPTSTLPAQPHRGRLRPERRDGRAPRRARDAAAGDRRLRDHRGRRGRRGPRGRAWTSWSPTTTRRARAASCPTRRSCTRRSAATRARTSARPASPTSSPARCYAAAGRDAAEADADLDLVALATVADCVPLRGENRRLVREGLAALARSRRPGLRALMRVAQGRPGRARRRARSASAWRRGSTPPGACTAPTPAWS